MKIRPKDLVSLGVFTAVYIALYFAVNMFAAFSPFIQPVTSIVVIVLCGIVFMLYLSRVRSTGMVFLMAVLLGVLSPLMGHHVITIVSAVIAGAGAQAIISANRERRVGLDVLGYAVFSLWQVGAVLPLLFLRQGTLDQVRTQMGDDYADTYAALMTPTFVLVMIVVYFLAGLVGGLLGRKMLAKHFVKAGIASAA